MVPAPQAGGPSLSDPQPSGRSRWTRTVEGRFSPPPDGEAEPQTFRNAGGTEAILVVEDHDPVREVIRTGLERFGYRVDAVRSADEALRHAQSPVGIDLLIADVVLPGMNGVAMAERIVAWHAGIRVLFVSAYASQESVPDQTINGRPCAFLAKPFSLHVLARSVRELIDRER